MDENKANDVQSLTFLFCCRNFVVLNLNDVILPSKEARIAVQISINEYALKSRIQSMTTWGDREYCITGKVLP